VKINPFIFRDYDIRGIVPLDLDSDIALHLGKAFGTFVKDKYGERVVVGHDNRKSSQDIKDKFVYGLMSTGCKVSDIGLSLTPIIHFLTFNKRFDSGVMVTASHNEEKFNGFRMCGRRAEPIFGDMILEIKQIVESESYLKGNGSIDYEDLIPEYESYYQKNFSFKSGLKVLVDCGNGTSSIIVGEIFEKLGINVSLLYCNLDGDYPHGIPDPENNLFMAELSEKVVEGGFDIGFAFDTDADRFGVVDDKGNIYENDKLLLLFAKHILKGNPGKKVLCDVKSTSLLEKFIKDFGGEHVMIRTGHPYFIKGLKEGAILGAEYSGHMYFGDKYFGFDDGLYSSVRLLEILSQAGMSLSKLMDEFPKTYHTGEIKYPCEEGEKDRLVQKVGESLKNLGLKIMVSEIDGVRVSLDRMGWFLVRASNTGSYISIRFESDTKEVFNKIADFLVSVLPNLPEILPSEYVKYS